MTKNIMNRRNQDVAEYLQHTTISDRDTESEGAPESLRTTPKTPSDSAMLAQELASESWAERYVPTTPSETVMTPTASTTESASSMVGERAYMTPEEEPPTYESIAGSSVAPSASSRDLGDQSRAPTQPHTLVPMFPQPRPHELLPSSSQTSEVQSLASQSTSERRPFLPSRSYSRHETSNSITGTFTVHDSLDLSTTSGTISIKLDVKPGPSPAILKLKTKSGSINVDDKQCYAAQSRRANRHPERGCPKQQCGSSAPGPLSFLFGWSKKTAEVEAPPMPATDDPRKQAGQLTELPAEESQVPPQEGEDEKDQKFVARVIHATIETSNGSVTGQLILTPGSATKISTSSGSINLRLTTADSAQSRRRVLSKLEQEDSRNAHLMSSTDFGSYFSTTSGSGSQNLHVQTGFNDTSGGAIVSSCQADHKVKGSGSVNIHYPRDWQGLVHASCGGSGSINVRGHGLEYDKRGNTEVYAWRGLDDPDLNKAVQIRVDGSGSIGFHC